MNTTVINLPSGQPLITRATFNGIRPGDKVTFSVPNGTGRHGSEFKQVTGRAVMCFSAHVVCNLGGSHGRPAVCDENNYHSHTTPRTRK
jgi:hypothetical protein